MAFPSPHLAALTVDGALTGSTATFGTSGPFTIDTLGNVVCLSIGNGTTALKIAGTGSWIANGSVATVLGSLGPVGSHTTVQEWLTVKDNSGTARFIPCF